MFRPSSGRQALVKRHGWVSLNPSQDHLSKRSVRSRLSFCIAARPCTPQRILQHLDLARYPSETSCPHLQPQLRTSYVAPTPLLPLGTTIPSFHPNPRPSPLPTRSTSKLTIALSHPIATRFSFPCLPCPPPAQPVILSEPLAAQRAPRRPLHRLTAAPPAAPLPINTPHM